MTEANDYLEDEPEHLAAIREALQAARDALKACIKIGDQPGIVKASRCIGDLGARLSRVGVIEKEKAEDNKARNAVVQEIIDLLEHDKCCDTRERQAWSVKQGQELRQRSIYGVNDTHDVTANTPDLKELALEPHRTATISSPDTGPEIGDK